MIEEKLKKVGLFGGTFDPIHHGHLNLAFELLEKGPLDEIWFIPTQLNPLKHENTPASFEHRLAMIELAIARIPSFVLNDIERHASFPSYTIDTVRSLLLQEKQKRKQVHHFYFILGNDSLLHFHKWAFPEEIVALVPLLIGSRVPQEFKETTTWSPLIQQAVKRGLIPTRLMDISSTQIRERLKNHDFCEHLLPFAVIEYIQKNHLYLSNG